MKKSKFNLGYLNSTTGNAGYLIPFLLQPTLPNDTFRISLTSFIRAQPMLAPLMHEIKFFTQYWFVPYRIIWNEWEDFITGGDDLTFSPAVPTLAAGTQFEAGSLGDYFGYPIGVDCGGISVLPFRAYNEIWNTRYRDEDLQTEVSVGYSEGSDNQTSLKLLSPSWKRDYFTTARPFTQRGSDITIPINSSDNTREIYHRHEFSIKAFFLNIAPISAYRNASLSIHITKDGSDPYSVTYSGQDICSIPSAGLYFKNSQQVYDSIATAVLGDATFKASLESLINSMLPSLNLNGSKTFQTISGTASYTSDATYTYTFSNVPVTLAYVFNNDETLTSSYPSQLVTFDVIRAFDDAEQGDTWGMWLIDTTYGDPQMTINIGVTLSQVGQVSVRDLRAASALQRYGERSLQWGNRYEEFIQREFGIKPRDSRIQRPEYLGGGKGTLQISEVLQTAEGADTGVGTMRGHGVAGIGQRPIKFRCPEHGLIIGLLSIRPVPVYTQGINREFLKRSRLDFFTPELANIGMQEVLQRELYVTADNQDIIFGYSDRYQEYRYNMPKVTGEFRTTLDFWNMARQFDAPPVLNDSFINMSSSENAFYRPFASRATHQFLMMLRNNIKAYRPIPKRAKNI